MDMAQFDAQQHRHQVQRGLLRRGRAQPGRSRHQFRRGCEMNCNIRPFQKRRRRHIGDAHHGDATGPGRIRHRQGIGRPARGRDGNQHIAPGQAAAPEILGRGGGVILDIAAHVQQRGCAARKQDGRAFGRDPEGAGQFQRIGKGHQARTARPRIAQPAALPQGRRSGLGRGFDGGNGCGKTVERIALRLHEKRADFGRRAQMQPVGMRMALFGRTRVHVIPPLAR
jgi:hypothetical protein